MRPIYLRLYETEETLVAGAEVPGFTGKELNVVAEPWRLVASVNGKRRARSRRRRNFHPPRRGRTHP